MPDIQIINLNLIDCADNYTFDYSWPTNFIAADTAQNLRFGIEYPDSTREKLMRACWHAAGLAVTASLGTALLTPAIMPGFKAEFQNLCNQLHPSLFTFAGPLVAGAFSFVPFAGIETYLAHRKNDFLDDQNGALDFIEAKYRKAWEPMWNAYKGYRSSPTSEQQEDNNGLWDELQDQYAAKRGLLALANGEAAGFAHYSAEEDYANYEDTDTDSGYVCRLEDLYVTPKMRRLGIGTRLIDALREAAKIEDCSELVMEPLEDNQEALAFFEKIATRTNRVEFRLPVPSSPAPT